MDRFRAMSYTRPPFARPFEARAEHDAGWSSPVARQAHNLKVVGSNPAPATKFMALTQRVSAILILALMFPADTMDAPWT